MGNFKVRVNSSDESKEVQDLLVKMGYHARETWNELGSIGGFIWTDSDMTFCDNKIRYFDESPRKEITLAELQVMVNPSLNDQYAEVEQVRQAIKVPDGNDSDHTADAMAYAFMGVGRDKVCQHRHYFIDVSDVDEIDFYEIALRYNVTDPCIQHILKKCLAVGQRGQKDFHHDLKDIYDTAKRMLAVHGLDS